MRPKRLTLSIAVADPNGICETQTPVGAGNLTINGALATAGVATMDFARHASVASDEDESGDTYTFTGTNRHHAAQTESITGPNNNTVTTTKNFLTVTQVAVSGAATGNITVGSADEADTKIIPTDNYAKIIRYSGMLSSGASQTFAIEYTTDDIYDSDFDEEVANWIDAATGKTADYSGTLEGGVTAIRGAITSFASGTFTLHIITPKK